MPHLVPIKEAIAKQNRRSDAVANLSWQMAAESHIGKESEKIVQKINPKSIKIKVCFKWHKHLRGFVI